jgi:hypothetical protein
MLSCPCVCLANFLLNISTDFVIMKNHAIGTLYNLLLRVILISDTNVPALQTSEIEATLLLFSGVVCNFCDKSY